MAERTFDLQVSGYTKGGYGVTLTTRDVEYAKLGLALDWLGSAMDDAGVQPHPSGNSSSQSDNPGWPDTKICPIHKVEMTLHEKGKSHWWSHKVVLEDGTEHWCRGK